MDYGTRSLVCEQVQLDKHHTIKTMYENYCRAFHPDEFADGIEENKLSLSTFKRTLKRGRFTRKCIQRTHVNQDPIEGVRFLEAIEHIVLLLLTLMKQRTIRSLFFKSMDMHLKEIYVQRSKLLWRCL